MPTKKNDKKAKAAPRDKRGDYTVTATFTYSPARELKLRTAARKPTTLCALEQERGGGKSAFKRRLFWHFDYKKCANTLAKRLRGAKVETASIDIEGAADEAAEVAA